MNDIAIVGMASRLPGASSIPDLWALIRSGKTTFEPVPRDLSISSGYVERVIDSPGFIPVRSTLDDPDAFDHVYFGLSPREATILDPQHRVFTETVWSALEDSGHAARNPEERIGIFGSGGPSTYLTGPLANAEEWGGAAIHSEILLANAIDFLCNRAAHLLGFTGPSVMVKSGSASSLLAVHLAIASLERGECDIAIVAGAHITIPSLGGYMCFGDAGVSPTGRATPFDAESDGTVPASGVAAVVLRRAAAAAASRDHVYAYIAGSSTNNDGNDRGSFTTPNPARQAEAISEAMARAGLSSAEIGYVETTGEGNPIGDRAEVHALRLGLGRLPDDRPLPLGSIRSTMGYLGTAAGVASLIKAALVLHHQVVPPLAGLTQPHPLIGLEEAALRLPHVAESAQDGIAAACVNAFGLGGTNVHVVLRRAQQAASQSSSPEPTEPAKPTELTEPTEPPVRDAVPLPHRVIVSGVTEETAQRTAHAIADALDADPSLRLGDVAFTLARGRPRLAYGVVVFATSIAELAAGLRTTEPLPLPAREVPEALDDVAAARSHYASEQPTDRRVSLPPTVLTRTKHWAQPPPLRDPIPLRLVPNRVRVKPSAHSPFPGRQPSRTSSRDLIRFTGEAGPTLFLVHPAGGTTACYADLAQHVDSRLALVGLSFPDRFMNIHLTVGQLAEHYVAAIRAQQPHGPYLVGGYDFGGNLAAEIALQLEDAGEEVDTLLIISAQPPHAYLSHQCTEADYLGAFRQMLRSLVPSLRFDEYTDPYPLSIDTPERMLERVISPRLSDKVRAELSNFFYVWRENYTSLRWWMPSRPLDCPVVVLEPQAPESPIVLGRLRVTPVPLHEWSRYTHGGLRIISVPGEHQSLFRRGASLTAMARALATELG